jgi:hypothetical protein
MQSGRLPSRRGRIAWVVPRKKHWCDTAFVNVSRVRCCHAGNDLLPFAEFIFRRRTMRAAGSGTTRDKRRAWEAPVVTKLAIGAETRSAPATGQGTEPAHPQAPADPSSKLGFSFEMAFPLSARFE